MGGMQRRIAVLVSISSLLALMPACAEHGTNKITFGGDREPSPPRSVGALISALECSYNEMDLERYLSLLDEDMVFTFVDRDSFGVPVERSWGYSAEEMLHHNMFADTSFPNYPDRVRLTLTIVDTTAAPEMGEGCWECLCAVDLKVDILGITYWANQDSEFSIALCSSDPEGLVIVHWEDIYEEASLSETSGTPTKVEPTQWGTIKTLYLE
jgi:hypothetical protein